MTRLTSPEIVRFEQLQVIYEGVYHLYFMDGAQEEADIVLCTIIEACQILERVCPGGESQNKNFYHKHVAAACVYVSLQMHSDTINRYPPEKYVEGFVVTDKTITKRLLVSCQKWVLSEISYNVWIGPNQKEQGKRPFMDWDQDLESRSLQERGFLAEHTLFPRACREGKPQNCAEFSEYMQNNKNLHVFLKSLREFCQDPILFRMKYFGWSIRPA